MPRKIRVPTTGVELGELLVVNIQGKPMLYLDAGSRDVIVSVSSFLVVMLDNANDAETKLRIHRVINHLSDMLYGFKEIEE
jgi:hypothetical protein